MTATATIPTITTTPTDSAVRAPGTSALVPAAGVPVLDRLAMRAGLALLLWAQHHAAQRSAPAVRVQQVALIRDARWYMS